MPVQPLFKKLEIIGRRKNMRRETVPVNTGSVEKRFGKVANAKVLEIDRERMRESGSPSTTWPPQGRRHTSSQLCRAMAEVVPVEKAERGNSSAA